MTRRPHRAWMFFSLLAAVVVFGVLSGARADEDEPRRYVTGEIKIGDRVEADPFHIAKWYKGTVTKINYVLTDPGAIDTFTTKLDPSPGQAPQTYKIIADIDHIRLLPADKDPGAPGKKPQDPENKPNDKPTAKNKPAKPMGTKPLVAGGPSETQIKDVILQWQEAKDKHADGNSKTTIEWDTAIKSAPVTHKNVIGIATTTFYPVKIDFTVTTEHRTRFEVYHWKGAIYDFYKDDFGDWKFILDGVPTFTEDGAKSVNKEN